MTELIDGPTLPTSMPQFEWPPRPLPSHLEPEWSRSSISLEVSRDEDWDHSSLRVTCPSHHWSLSPSASSTYLDDHFRNHKESVEIMHELEDATGIDARALVSFQPGMRDSREKLQWASTRITTVPEDIVYSLFGIPDTQLPIPYGENKQNALGRLPQEIIARSGDITALDWVGQPSEFNSYFPANISSYEALSCVLPSLSEGELETAVSSLRQTVAEDLASRLYDKLDTMSAPRCSHCRLHLPCMTFRVTEVRRRSGPPQETFFVYAVKADGLDDLLITTEVKLRPRASSRRSIPSRSRTSHVVALKCHRTKYRLHYQRDQNLPEHKLEACRITLHITGKITRRGVCSPSIRPLADARSVK